MRIEVGYCGPTDCCLKIVNGSQEKQYALESDAWRLLDFLLLEGYSDPHDPLYKRFCEIVWNNFDKDLFNESSEQAR